MLYRIGEFELDTDNFELRRDGEARHVEPLVFDLLRFFSENPARIISRDEVIDHVWGGRIVSEATISSCIKSARKALGDSGENQSYIQTVRGRGFRFVGAVDAPGENSDSPNQARPAPAAPVVSSPSMTDPSLIIMPFQILSEDPQVIQTASGLAESLTTVLTRIPLLGIVSRASSFALKDQTIDARGIGEKFGANYMLEGSLQVAGEVLVVNVQLIETVRGTHLWAQQFHQRRAPEEMFELLKRVLGQLEPQLMRAMLADLGNNEGEMSSRQLLLYAMSTIALKGWHTGSFSEARDLLGQATIIDPVFALAHAYLSLILGLGVRVGLFSGTPDEIAHAIAIAEKALELDNMDSTVLGLAGCALADVGEVDRAIPILRKATAINPNNAQAQAALGSAYQLQGNVDEAIRHLTLGIDISPLDNSLAVWGSVLALAYLQKKDLDAAQETVNEAIANDDRNYMPRIVLTAIHTLRGDRDGAMRALAECYRVKPDLSQREMEGMLGKPLAAKVLKLTKRL